MEKINFIIIVLVACAIYHMRADVTCTSNGRFPNPNDTTCQNYYMCVYVSNNASFISYNYTCPKTSVFNPNTKLCTTDYVCNVTKNNNLCSVEGRIPDPKSSNCTGFIECIGIDGKFIENVLTCPGNSFFNPTTTDCDATYTCPRSCPSQGRFANATDTTCKSYILCVQANNGTLIGYSYTCPSVSVFNPVTKLCTTQYTCSRKKSKLIN